MFKPTKAAPMNGMALMLKSFGINLPEIQALVETQIANLLATAQGIEAQLKEHNERLARIEEKLNARGSIGTEGRPD